jgi:tetratricopeptide (TPR) repeat protein
LNYYKLIYKNDNKDVEAINGFGRIYHKQTKYSKASFYFQKAISLLPTYMQQYFDLAQVYIEKGDLDRWVRGTFQSTCSHHPNHQFQITDEYHLIYSYNYLMPMWHLNKLTPHEYSKKLLTA